MSDDRPCTCPPMERPHPCARKFALSECKVAAATSPFCYLTQTSSAKNPPHGWSVHFIDGDIPLYSADALAAAREEGRQAGLDEAAGVCEKYSEDYEYTHVAAAELRATASMIRALKENTNLVTIKGLGKQEKVE